MLYNIWRWIQLWLPFGLILHMYKYNKCLPTNIKTRHGLNLKAILITKDYGIICTQEEYIKNRGKLLKEKQAQVAKLNDSLMAEINSLSFEEREYLYNNRDDEDGTV